MKIPDDSALWNWSLTNVELGKLHHLKPSAVGQIRRALGKPQARSVVVDWSSIDWNKTTDEIKRDIGCSRPLVSSMRRKFAPHTLAVQIS